MPEYTPIGLDNGTAPVRALTHSGNFHADETLGYVILHYALAPGGICGGGFLAASPPTGLISSARDRPNASGRLTSCSMWGAGTNLPQGATTTI